MKRDRADVTEPTDWVDGDGRVPVRCRVLSGGVDDAAQDMVYSAMLALPRSRTILNLRLPDGVLLRDFVQASGGGVAEYSGTVDRDIDHAAAFDSIQKLLSKPR